MASDYSAELQAMALQLDAARRGGLQLRRPTREDVGMGAGVVQGSPTEPYTPTERTGPGRGVKVPRPPLPALTGGPPDVYAGTPEEGLQPLRQPGGHLTQTQARAMDEPPPGVEFDEWMAAKGFTEAGTEPLTVAGLTTTLGGGLPPTVREGVTDEPMSAKEAVAMGEWLRSWDRPEEAEPFKFKQRGGRTGEFAEPPTRRGGGGGY